MGSLALFFWGHWLVQLAGWEELLLVGGRHRAAGRSRCSSSRASASPGSSASSRSSAGLVLSLVGAGATPAVSSLAVGARRRSRAAGRHRGEPGRCCASCRACRSAAGSSWTPSWARGAATRSAPETTALARQARHARVAAAAGRHRRHRGRSAWTSSPRASSSTPGSPMEVMRVDGNRIVVRRATSTPTKGVSHDRNATTGLVGAARRSSSWSSRRSCCVLYLVPVPLWIAAWASGAYVGLFTLVGMRLRRVPPEHGRHGAHQRGEGGPRHLRQRPGGPLPGRRQRGARGQRA